jgi:hypothetical protein
MSSFTDDLEREISEDIKRDMAKREEHIRKSTSEYRIICEETEAQISTYFEDECRILWVMVMGVIALDWWNPPYKFAGFMILLMVVIPVFKWIEKQRLRKQIIKDREFCAEPTFDDRRCSLQFSHVEGSLATDKYAEETRDNVRRTLIRDEVRFRHRYGQKP